MAKRLGELLEQPVRFANDCVGPEVEKTGSVIWAAAKSCCWRTSVSTGPKRKNDPDFAAQLAKLGDLYVNDAFGAAHRAHASTHAVAKILPAAAGFLMATELDQLGALLSQPKRPFVAILGGAKVTDKLGVLESLIEKADVLLVGGGMAFTFLAAQGHSIGKSLCEDDLELPKRILKAAKEKSTELVLPEDVAVAPKLEKGQDPEHG